jgi:hypothetical protein
MKKKTLAICFSGDLALACTFIVTLGILVIPCSVSHSQESSPQTAADTNQRPIDFEKLETSDGKIYQRVTVRKIEPDSLLVEHLTGMARISLFDVSEEIQQHYEFDRDAAMAHYQARDAEQRALRKQMLLERVRLQAAEEAQTRRENLERRAKLEWVPVRARIVKIRGSDALAFIDRIVLKETRTKTVFGGEGLPGPPKKEYVRLSKDPVWLRNIATEGERVKTGSYWNGYIWPDGDVSLDPNDPTKTAAAFRAIRPREKK